MKVAIHVELCIDGNVPIQGELENISFSGLLLRCEANLPEHTPCLVFLHFDGGQGGHIIKALGVILRKEPHKLAIQLIELISVESANHLQNLVL